MSWEERAACWGLQGKGFDWFPEDPSTPEALGAKALCETCPVREACLAFANSPDTCQPFGIWGGQFQEERSCPDVAEPRLPGRRLELEEREEILRAYDKGETMAAISRRLDRPRSTVRNIVDSVHPRPSGERPNGLKECEREAIREGVRQGESGSAIARSLGRPKATIIDEIARMGGREAIAA